jgi:hypothetical protein
MRSRSSGSLRGGVGKRLTEVVQLLQVYCSLAELEIAAGERPKAEDIALPENTGQRVRQWAEAEEGKMREGKELAEELSARTRGEPWRR